MPIKTEYIIEILKQGDGAMQATADFQKVGAAATAAKTQVAGFGATIGASTGEAAIKTREAQRVIVSSLHLIAFSAFPEVAGAATVTTASFHAVRASAALLGTGIVAMGGVFAALAVAVWITVAAIRAWKAELLGAQSENELIAANGRLNKTLQEQIGVMEERGLLSAEQASALRTEAVMARARAESAQEESKSLHDVAAALIAVQTQENTRIKLSGDARRLFSELNLAEVEGHERERRAAGQNLADRMAAIEKLANARGLDADEVERTTQQAIAAYRLEMRAIDDIIKKEKERAFSASVTGQILDQANQQFASSHSRFIVDSIRQGRFEIKAFAADFMAAMAQMILQTIIFNAVKKGLSLLGGSIGGGGGGGGIDFGVDDPGFAALGGVWPSVQDKMRVQYAANGVPGVMTVSQPTFFRDFNVVAGEVPGQPEMLTVLNRPRMMEIGGIQAAVGNAAGHRLAITGANDLARAGGAGGHIIIELRAQPGYEARIIQNSVERARVVVVNDMTQDSDLSKATRRLAT